MVLIRMLLTVLRGVLLMLLRHCARYEDSLTCKSYTEFCAVLFTTVMIQIISAEKTINTTNNTELI